MVLGGIVSPSFLTVATSERPQRLFRGRPRGAGSRFAIAVALRTSIPATVALGALVALGAGSMIGRCPLHSRHSVAAFGGLVNGVLIGYVRINPIIVTLASGFLLLGLAQLLVGGGIVYAEPSAFGTFVAGNLLGLPVAVWIFFIVALILHITLSRTPFGRWNFAVGGNYEASAASAVPVRFTRATPSSPGCFSDVRHPDRARIGRRPIIGAGMIRRHHRGDRRHQPLRRPGSIPAPSAASSSSR
jgi:ribose transport system permease protein